MKNQKGAASIWLIVLIVVVAGVAGYFAFQNKSNNNNEAIDKISPAITSPGGERVGYIKSIYEENEKTYIDLDEIQFFYGEAAINAMREDGVCEKYEDNDCFSPSGAYLRDKEPTTEKIEVRKDAKIIMVKPCVDEVVGVSISLDEFKNSYGSSEPLNCNNPILPFYVSPSAPYWINQDESGVVISITEQYMP